MQAHARDLGFAERLNAAELPGLCDHLVNVFHVDSADVSDYRRRLLRIRILAHTAQYRPLDPGRVRAGAHQPIVHRSVPLGDLPAKQFAVEIRRPLWVLGVYLKMHRSIHARKTTEMLLLGLSWPGWATARLGT